MTELARRKSRTSLAVLRGPDGRPPLRSLFVRHYAWIRDRFAHRDLGLAVVAIHERGALSAATWLAARPDRAASAIVGRHPRVDVALDGEDISLRHLALVVHPARSWAPTDLRVQVHDLRTDAGFWGEHGERLAGVLAEGALLLWCGDHALFALPTGDVTDWPPEPATAWSFLPERVYLDERSPPPREGPAPAAASFGTVITLLEPLMTLAECGASERSERLGDLSFRGPGDAVRCSVSTEAARRGILLGSYPRCDEHALLASSKVSRVHLLLLLMDGVLHAIDTASTNRTILDGRRILRHPTPLRGPTSLALAKGAATLDWSPR